jgi:hypothetical protein
MTPTVSAAARQVPECEFAAGVGGGRTRFWSGERDLNAGDRCSGDIGYHAVNFGWPRLRVHEPDENSCDEDRHGDASTHGGASLDRLARRL